MAGKRNNVALAKEIKQQNNLKRGMAVIHEICEKKFL